MTVTLDARAANLERANHVRLAMCEIKLLVATRAVTIGQALADERAGSVAVFDLIRAVPRYGPERTRRLLSRLLVPERKPCRALTDRQRRTIADAIGDHA